MSIDQNKRRKNPQITQLTMEQVNEKFRDYEARISQLEGIGADADMHGRRITNLGDAEQARDAINRGVLITTVDEALDSAIQPIESALLSNFLVLSETQYLENERYWRDGHGIFSVDGGSGKAFTPSVKEEELDHNRLDNLAVGDVHTHYFLLAGRAGGQIGSGGTLAGETLALKGSAHANRGPITLNANLAVDAQGDLALTKDGASGIYDILAYGDGHTLKYSGKHASGIFGGATATAINQELVGLYGYGHDGTDWKLSGHISITSRIQHGATEAGTAIRCRTILAGDATRTLEDRLYIDKAGNIQINIYADPAVTTPAMVGGILMQTKTPPSSVVGTNRAALYTKDANNVATKFWWHGMGEESVEHQLAGIIYKTDAGDPAIQHDGSLLVNTNESKIKIHPTAAMGWREFLTVENADFRGYQAIAMVCHKGTTFPTSPAPAAGQWFYRSDLKILYLYQTGWQARISFGEVTMYVDGTLGENGISQGYGPGADATLTIQYALNRVPPINGGNVTINVAAGTYNESLIIQGKYYTGNYSLIIQGELTDVQSGTSSGDGVLGTGATQGSVLDAGNMTGHADKLIYLAADGDYRIIDSVDVGGDNATIVGTFTSKPLSGEAYVIKDWGTIVSGVTSVTLRPGQFNVEFYDIAFSGSTKSLMATQADVTFERCKFSSYVQPRVSTAIVLTNCLIAVYAGGNTLRVETTTVATVTRCKIFNDGVSAGYCIWGFNGSQVGITSGTVIDCGKPNANNGMLITLASAGGCYSTVANGYCRIRNAAIGISAYGGGVAQNTANNQYSGNTADETVASAPDWGYID